MIDATAMMLMLMVEIHDYEEFCGEAANELLVKVGRGDILYIECLEGATLKPTYNKLEIDEYVAFAFGDQVVTLSLNGEDFFHGPAVGIMAVDGLPAASA